MYYYKFKVFYDEVEDFVRDVDVLANTNFEDFHHFLYECLGLQGNEFAAFSICDQKWNKQKEITIMDTSEDEEMTETPEYDDEDSFSTKTRLPKFVMKDAILKDFITDPHQHIMYEYDFMNPKVFYIELQKVLQTDDAAGFPRCTYKMMEMPAPVINDLPGTGDLDLDLEEEDEEPEVDELFGDGYDMDDFSDLNEMQDF